MKTVSSGSCFRLLESRSDSPSKYLDLTDSQDKTEQNRHRIPHHVFVVVSWKQRYWLSLRRKGFPWVLQKRSHRGVGIRTHRRWRSLWRTLVLVRGLLRNSGRGVSVSTLTVSYLLVTDGDLDSSDSQTGHRSHGTPIWLSPSHEVRGTRGRVVVIVTLVIESYVSNA